MINQNTDDEAKKILDALGDGVAREDTAQEILEKVSDTTGMIVGSANTSAANTTLNTVLSITGRGRLGYAYLMNTINTGQQLGELCIIVDGETIFDVTAKNSAGSTTNTSGAYVRLSLVTPPVILWGGTSSQIVVPGITITSDGTAIAFRDSLTTTYSASSTSVMKLLYALDGIHFNDSLIIQCRTTTSSGYICHYGYYLDE